MAISKVLLLQWRLGDSIGALLKANAVVLPKGKIALHADSLAQQLNRGPRRRSYQSHGKAYAQSRARGDSP
jgi:hypothetical protein